MTKNTSAAFNTHIQGESTTLSALFRATRRDGVQFFFTDHDRDITINVDDPADTDNADTYEAETGFTRTSIVNTSSLSVDNMDIESVLDSEGVQEADVRAGLWDFAEIEVYMVNWDDLTMGVMQLRRGYMGEVSLRDEIYFAELRGMAQLLQQVVGDIYTPNCRADHGDDKCRFDLSLTTETTEVDAIAANNRIITVPATFIGRTDIDQVADFLFIPGVKVDDTADPSIGKMTLLRHSSVEDGTFRNPFLLDNATDVENMADDLLAWYALTSDIDMTAHGLFTPVGDNTTPFTGGLDGRGYQIQNLNLDHSGIPLGRPVGLFGTVERANIVRVGIVDPDVNAGESAQYKAALVGSTLAGTVIEDCYVEDTGVGNIETDGDRAGGLVGLVTGATVRRCWAAIGFTGAIGTRVGGTIAFDNGSNTFSLNKQDTDVGITDLGNGISTADVQVLTTAEMQTRVNWVEPLGATLQLVTAQLPDRAASFFDFYTVWIPPVVATDYPRLRQWF